MREAFFCLCSHAQYVRYNAIPFRPFSGSHSMRRPGYFTGAWSSWQLQVASLHLKSWNSLSASSTCSLPTFVLVSERGGRRKQPAEGLLISACIRPNSPHTSHILRTVSASLRATRATQGDKRTSTWISWHLQVTSLRLKSWTSLSASSFSLPIFGLVSERSGRCKQPAEESSL